MNTETRPPLWLTLLAFAAIYLIWGSTYFAIRVGVGEVPPEACSEARPEAVRSHSRTHEGAAELGRPFRPVAGQ